jgi:hypothetical protein
VSIPYLFKKKRIPMKKMTGLFLLFPLLILAQADFDNGEKLYREEKYEQAKVVFESVLKQNPSHLKTIEYLGDIAGHRKSPKLTIIINMAELLE